MAKKKQNKEEKKKKTGQERKKRTKQVKTSIEKNKKQKQDEQVKWFLIIVGLVFLSFIMTYFYVQSSKTFGFANLKWEKTKYQNIDFYHSRFAVFENYYNLYLRNDPRENDVLVNFSTDIKFHPKIFMSLGADAINCPDAGLANFALGQFLGAFKFQVEGSVTDEELAEALDVRYITCDHAANQTVIIMQKSEETLVTQDENNRDCYIINIGQCENIKASEKFILEVVEQINSVS